MQGVAQLGIFTASLAGVATMLAVGMRIADKNRAPVYGSGDSERIALADAAGAAYNQALAEQLPLAGVAEHHSTPAGAVAWFEKNIRKFLRVHADADGVHITRGELNRYLRWARTVH